VNDRDDERRQSPRIEARRPADGNLLTRPGGRRNSKM
jgi:hypothetical protein